MSRPEARIGHTKCARSRGLFCCTILVILILTSLILILATTESGVTGSIEVYLDQGQGYPDTPTLQATDASYPELRRLGWTAGGSGFDFYVDWIMAVEGGAP